MTSQLVSIGLWVLLRAATMRAVPSADGGVPCCFHPPKNKRRTAFSLKKLENSAQKFKNISWKMNQRNTLCANSLNLTQRYMLALRCYCHLLVADCRKKFTNNVKVRYLILMFSFTCLFVHSSSAYDASTNIYIYTNKIMFLQNIKLLKQAVSANDSSLK